MFVGQVNLKVENLERALLFYQHIIGFKVLEQTERNAKLTADGKTNLLTLEQLNDVTPRQRNTTGLYHFAILLPKRSDLANIVQHLYRNGIQFGSSDHLVSEALYLSDPDGNGIEIYIDRPSSSWNWINGEVEMTVDPLDFKNLLTEINQESWNGLPQETVMGHIHLHVSELQKTQEFYSKGLGFQVVCRYGTQALFISTGGYHHHIGLNTWAGVGAPRPSIHSAGLKSFSLVLANEEVRNNIIKQLQALGYNVIEENGIVITEDPSGNRIQLTI
jgi:catechol 2,3-dioxygenase